jgi:hypothetical protein
VIFGGIYDVMRVVEGIITLNKFKDMIKGSGKHPQWDTVVKGRTP